METQTKLEMMRRPIVVMNRRGLRLDLCSIKEQTDGFKTRHGKQVVISVPVSTEEVGLKNKTNSPAPDQEIDFHGKASATQIVYFIFVVIIVRFYGSVAPPILR